MSEFVAGSLAEKAWKRGEEAGRTEGWREGRKEGEILGIRASLRMLLEERFGSLPVEILQRIEACEDLNRLQTAIRQCWKLEKLEDIQL